MTREKPDESPISPEEWTTLLDHVKTLDNAEKMGAEMYALDHALDRLYFLEQHQSHKKHTVLDGGGP